MSSYTGFQVDLKNKNSSWTLVYEKIKNNSKVLDVGCSSGYFDKVLIDQKNCTVDGVELDPDDARLAEKICRRITVGNIEDDDFSWEGLDDDYDHILFIDVLEHLVDPAKTLEKVAGRLSKDGSIVFSIPNMANGSVRLQLLQGNFDYEKDGLLDETHMHYYTEKTVGDMVRKSGLKLTSFDYTSFDVPRSTIDLALERVGLSATTEFYDYLKSKESVIYQFIGVLSLSGKMIDIKKSAQVIKPRQDYERQIKEVQKEAQSVFANMEIVNRRFEAVSKENEQLKAEQQKHANGIASRISRKVRKLYRG